MGNCIINKKLCINGEILKKRTSEIVHKLCITINENNFQKYAFLLSFY